MILENQLIAWAREILDLQDQIFEEEDGFYEIWLMEGVPNGYTQQDLIREFCEDYNWYFELHNLAIGLLIKRQMRDLN